MCTTGLQILTSQTRQRRKESSTLRRALAWFVTEASLTKTAIYNLGTSEYSFPTALCEIIDNSVEATAKGEGERKISVSIEYKVWQLLFTLNSHVFTGKETVCFRQWSRCQEVRRHARCCPSQTKVWIRPFLLFQVASTWCILVPWKIRSWNEIGWISTWKRVDCKVQNQEKSKNSTNYAEWSMYTGWRSDRVKEW